MFDSCLSGDRCEYGYGSGNTSIAKKAIVKTPTSIPDQTSALDLLEAISQLRCLVKPYQTTLWTTQSIDQSALQSMCKALGVADFLPHHLFRDLRTVLDMFGADGSVAGLDVQANNRSCWSHAALKTQREFHAANRYRDLKVKSQPVVRSAILGCLVEIEQTTAAAIAGVVPNPFLWGKLTAASFLTILEDVTTWALTHFEPVRCWSVAEDFTPTEEQEGYGLIGRGQRMSASDYRPEQLTRSLFKVTNPKIRGAALWTAHALLATCHTAASDRSSGATPQCRQAALLAGSAPASRQWLAQRQANWPTEYRRSHWIDVQQSL